MRARDLTELLILAALWGGSFLFMRVAAPEFGPAALIEVRVGLAALLLLPVLAWRGKLAPLWRKAGPLLFVGLTNSALPFVLYAWAALSVTAGFASIVNATSPLFAALVAWVWLKDRLSAAAAFGLLLGLLGVMILVWGKASFQAGGSGWAVAACLAATLNYGIAANFTKRHLTGVDPMAIATGSQLYAALVLAPFAVWLWPQAMPSREAWIAVLLLAFACTGVAYVMYFRLIAHIGPARAIAVTFLIPVFGMLWGAMLLDEEISSNMLAGCAVILAGTGLATGAIRLPRRPNVARGRG
ncbi:DMT family transporter [Aromatoleum petrolei]|uniref:EamA family transporter n=1 Tax=Aromatoleum petrolei TaxID=76116 RepID=A0ABX1MK12_9RHOO|nr:DMT family transporter [Aromatoleum petrolei]NMF88298.1 EamA family transporter [Aromatoleum petrolei]QTQ38004.1 EamA domain-containing protein [Aromatoleum petrolei]